MDKHMEKAEKDLRMETEKGRFVGTMLWLLRQMKEPWAKD